MASKMASPEINIYPQKKRIMAGCQLKIGASNYFSVISDIILEPVMR